MEGDTRYIFVGENPDDDDDDEGRISIGSVLVSGSVPSNQSVKKRFSSVSKSVWCRACSPHYIPVFRNYDKTPRSANPGSNDRLGVFAVSLLSLVSLARGHALIYSSIHRPAWLTPRLYFF
jgi:hypothetical protein